MSLAVLLLEFDELDDKPADKSSLLSAPVINCTVCESGARVVDVVVDADEMFVGGVKVVVGSPASL